ncbi:MAG: hypothetical protein ACRD0Z_11625 [Acidimicrobiales bacterium]
MSKFSTSRPVKQAGLPVVATALIALLLALLAAVQVGTSTAASAAARPGLEVRQGEAARSGLPDLAGISTTAAIASLDLDGATVKTSNGVSWSLTVDASSTGAVELVLERLDTKGGTGDEIYSWDLGTATVGDLKFSTSTGVGTVNTGTKAVPLATVDVTFKATAHKADVCSSGSETSYTGTLSGEAELVTGLTGGGTVGGKSLKFTVSNAGSKPTVTVDKDCSLALDCPATTDVTFSAVPSGTSPLFLEGASGPLNGKVYDLVTISSSAKLAKPAGATRLALAYLEAAPAKWDKSTSTLSVAASTSGLITGSATLSGSQEFSFSLPCTTGGKKSSVTETAYAANLSSPAGHALAAHFDLLGKVAFPTTLKNTASSPVSIVTLAPK